MFYRRIAKQNYLKKLGLINLKIAPIIPSIAIPIATFVIFAFHDFASHEAHCTPPTTIITKDTNKITVTSIFVAALIITGNAFNADPSSVLQLDFGTQRPTNGMLVLRGIHVAPTHCTQYLQLHELLFKSVHGELVSPLSAIHLSRLHLRAAA